MSANKILIVEDDPKMREALRQIMNKEGYSTEVAQSGEEALSMVKNSNYSLAISDLKLPGIDGMDVLRAIKKYKPSISVIIVTAFGTIDSAVAAMKEGADDYLTKPFNIEEIRFIVAKVFEKRMLTEKNALLMSQLQKKYTFENIIGVSEPMVSIFKLINKIKDSKTTVLISGETGSGKELVARAIHYNSIRANNIFLPVNCAALNENIIESELFGYVKGSFTGANRDKIGIFEAAEGGTIFLDEIGDISLGLQQVLLRTLEDGEIQPVGSTSRKKVSVRVIAATNKDLELMVKENKFREDLLYRLNVIVINVPPLRDRISDIGLLAKHFLEKYSQENNKDIKTIAPETLSILEAYNWPGNVRELENVIERATLLETEEEITPESLPQSLIKHSLSHKEGGRQKDEEAKTLEHVGRSHIIEILNQTKGNKAKAAKILGINRTTLWRMMQRYEIKDFSD